MALNASTVWEVRSTGSQTNGGGFYNRNPGTSIDYSQQDSPQLSLSDIATDTAGTGLSSATGGFTAAMVGNIIYITGGGTTTGWYEIVSYTDGNNVTIDRSAGASKTAVTGNVGGAFKIGGSLDGDFFSGSNKVAGNTVYIKAGSYTLGEIITNQIGTVALPIIICGYNTSRNDEPIGDNRPLIDCGSYIFYTNNYHILKNIRFTGTSTSVVTAGGSSIVYNCKAVNTSGTALRYGFYGSNNSIMLLKCEAVSTNGYAISFSSYDTVIQYCYIHDSSSGILAATVLNCVVANCSGQGIAAGSQSKFIIGNTIYGCGTGINFNTYAPITINNIISGCTTGMSAGSEGLYRNGVIKNNCLYNTTDLSNVTLDATNMLATNPLLNNPSSGDFTLQSGSPCFDAGMQPDSMIGL